MDRHALFQFGLFLVIACLVLAGCGKKSTPTATATPTPTPLPTNTATATATSTPTPLPTATATPAPTPTEALRCEDSLGCVEISPGEPVRVAYLLAISGYVESLGIDTARGIELAVGDQGEILGHPIELVAKDAACEPDVAEASAREVARDPTILAVIGTNCSGAARAAMPVISEAGLLMVSPSNVAVELTDPASHVPGYARTAHNDLVQTQAAAQFAWYQLGARTVATVSDGSLYTDNLQQAFAEEFERLGGRITAQETVEPFETDMIPVLTRVAADSPDLIYCSLFETEAGPLAAQVGEVAGLENVALMGPDVLFAPYFLDEAGEAAVGVYVSALDEDVWGTAYEDFVARYQEKYGEAPTSAFHAQAYDAAMLIFDAVERAALEGGDGTLYVGRQALREAFLGAKNYPGLTGSLSCNRYGDCANPVMAVYEIVDGDSSTWNPGSAADSNPHKVWNSAGWASLPEPVEPATPTPAAVATPTPGDLPGELPSDPVEAIQVLSLKASQMQSAHFGMILDMDMDLGTSSVTMVMDAEGDLEMTGPLPEDANMYMEVTLSLLGRRVEMDMIVLEGEYWVREQGGVWQKQPPDAAGTVGGLDPVQSLKYLEQATDVKELADELVDGVDCYHYSYALEAGVLSTQEMLEQLLGSGQMTDEQAREALETMEMVGEVWAGKADLFPRQQVIAMYFEVSDLSGLQGITVEYDMQIDIRFSQINEPVEIEAP